MVDFGDIIPFCGCLSIILFVLLLGLFSAFIGVLFRRGFKNAMKALASETGCSYQDGGIFGMPSVGGVYRGRNMLVDVYVERHHHGGDSRDTSTTYTRIRVNHSGLIPGEINIYPETFFSAIGKKLGMQDVEVGNPDFDKTFIVKGNDESLVRRILDLDMQQKLLRLKMQVHVYSNSVYVQKVGYIKDKSLIINMLNVMADLAEKIEKVSR